MLKLERLELSGFKSFVDPVRVEFAGGITAIVGPNGCGKSNLSDGMTWVLGEQSAKSLRGGSMEDVIFNGSEQRKPLGMAEVTLQLRAHPGDLAGDLPSTAAPRATPAGRRARRSVVEAEEGRITIGRRVFRGGESQYRLNGRTVRLKDVRDLLMDTGLGIRAYSVIEQGKIGMILSGKPQERRRLLEEAAGITRYKVRKGLAEVKLEEATANLLRLDDVISEVERALRSLKRQAGAARRYQQAEAEYRGLLDRVLRGRWAALAAHLAAVRGRLEEAVERDAALAADLHRDEAAVAAGRELLETIARELAERHQRQADLAATIEGRQQLLKGHRRAVEEILERAAQAQALAERRQGELGRLETALAEHAERRQALAAERGQAAAAVSADERQIADAEQGLRQAQARLEAARAEVLARTAEVNTLRGRLQQVQLELERGSVRHHHLEQELDRQAHELGTAAEALALAQQKAADLEAALAERAAEHERVAAGPWRGGRCARSRTG
jgi:chromosome segregation protein